MTAGGSEEIRKKATLAELGALVGGLVEGDGSLEILGMASLEDAGEGQLSFLADLKHVLQAGKNPGRRGYRSFQPSSFPEASDPDLESLCRLRQSSDVFFNPPLYSRWGLIRGLLWERGRKSGRKFQSIPLFTWEAEAESETGSSSIRASMSGRKPKSGRIRFCTRMWSSWIAAGSAGASSFTEEP